MCFPNLRRSAAGATCSVPWLAARPRREPAYVRSAVNVSDAKPPQSVPENEPVKRSPAFSMVPEPVKVPEQGTLSIRVNVKEGPLMVPVSVPEVPARSSMSPTARLPLQRRQQIVDGIRRAEGLSSLP